MDRKTGHLSFRELLGFLLLTVLLLLGLLSSWYLNRPQQALADQLEDSAWLALSGQWEKARKGVEEARKSWEQRRGLWAVFADHTPMEEIDAQFSRLTVYAAAREKGSFAAACTTLARQLEALGGAQQLRWQNVL